MLCNFFILICCSVVESLPVTCDRISLNFRRYNRNVLQENGIIYVLVGYTLIDERDVSGSPIGVNWFREVKGAEFLMPTTLRHHFSGNVTDYELHSNRVQATFGVEMTPSNDSKKILFTMKDTVTDVLVMFQACRMFINDKQKTFEVEKSLIFINTGELSQDRLNASKKEINTPVKYFEFQEFNDQGYNICRQLNYYFNNCPEEEKKSFTELLVILALVLIFIVGLVTSTLSKKFILMRVVPAETFLD